VKAQHGSSVPLADLVGADRIEDRLGELEQANQVGDGRAVQPEPAGQFVLGPAVAGQVIAEGGRLVDRVQVLALEVLDHGQLEDAPIIQVEYPRGDLVKLGLDAGAEPSFAGDELVARTDGADQYRLEHAMLPERVGQRGDLLRVELPARLER